MQIEIVFSTMIVSLWYKENMRSRINLLIIEENVILYYDNVWHFLKKDLFLKEGQGNKVYLLSFFIEPELM